MLKLRPKKPSVELNEQYWQSLDASGFVRYPPAIEMYGLMYCEHDCPEGGWIVTSSTGEHTIGILPIAAKIPVNEFRDRVF